MLKTEDIVVVRDPLPLAELRSFPLDLRRSHHQAWLAGGNELVLVCGCRRCVFLWIVDVESRTVRERVSVRTPGRFDPGSFSQDGDRIWAVGEDGVLELSRRDWEVLSWRPYRELLPPEAPSYLGGRVFPGTSYLWLYSPHWASGDRAYVLDLASWRLHRQVSGVDWTLPVLTSGGTLVLGPDPDESPRLYRADGDQVAGGELPVEEWVMALAGAPDGRGFIRLTVALNKSAGRWDAHLAGLQPLSGAYRVVPVTEIHGVSDETRHPVVTSHDIGLCFVLAETAEELVEPPQLRSGKLLVALAFDGGEPRELYRVEVPYTADLAQDRDCRSAAVLWSNADGLEVLPLGPEPPAADRIPAALLAAPWNEFPKVSGKLMRPRCPDRAVDDEIFALDGALCRRADKPGELNWVPFYAIDHGDDPEALVRLGYAIVSKSFRTMEIDDEASVLAWDLDRLCELLAERYPRHSGAALLLAQREARYGRWASARCWLEAVEEKELDTGRRSHLWLLWGLVLLHEERTTEAYRAFRKASRYKHRSWRLDDLVLLAKPMSDPPEPGEWGVDQPLLRQLVGAIRTAERAHRDGDLAAAVAALDRPVVWASSELQSLARLAALVLESPARAPAELFHKRLIVAHFCAVYVSLGSCATRFDLPGVTMEMGEVEGLAERGLAWLGDEVEEEM
jgi:tetratricopeptide (TPR) repeat protein